MNEYGDLLDDIDLWINDLNSLNEYFKYKYLIQCKKIPLNNCPTEIKEKIKYFKDVVMKNKIDVESFYKKERKPEMNFLGKKLNLSKKRINLNKSKDFYNKIDFKTNEEEDENSELSIKENTFFNFDSMLYEELADLYYNGKLKGDCLDECYKRICEFEVQSCIK